VGGTHYQDNAGTCPHCGGVIQHWDLFARMPYLVGYACRYVMRFKNGEEDLDKAIHTIEKMKAVYYPKPTKESVEEQLAHLKEMLRLGIYNIDQVREILDLPKLTILPYPPPGALPPDKCGGDGTYAPFVSAIPKIDLEIPIPKGTLPPKLDPLLTTLPYPPPGALEEAERWAAQHPEATMRREWFSTRPGPEHEAAHPDPVHGQTSKSYLDWAYAGGPDECVHGCAKGIPCPQCDATAARARADAFASGKPSDVPVGWVLEEVHGKPGYWHYRKAAGGVWGAEYLGRELALRYLIAVG
jgi:hypothetical protein